ncbi:transposase IS481 family protein [Luteococcus japonicus]|uniref:Transposase IS481 family protein n=1 Tax=Luteococcus japonicus TaxID=33984 RepID=A0A3N1ZSA2_9ACTN|nr:transposase IS481 family protein [Luteococcus japonicus]
MSQKDLPLNTHANAPLSLEGRRRLVERCQHRPIAHVAKEMGISRACASKWVNRHRDLGDPGLLDGSSAPHTSPTRTPDNVIEEALKLRRAKKWSAAKISTELAEKHGLRVSTSTIQRHLRLHNLHRRRFLDLDGEPVREPQKITARYPGHMIHMDVKKAGKIPDGGGWRIHGRDSDQARQANRAKKGQKVGYTYFHSAIDGFSRLAYTEALPDEKATTVIGFWARARAWFSLHGIGRITRLVTDNGPCYKAHAFERSITGHVAKHQYIRAYTPRHNGKVERYNRILAEEFLYARPFTSDAQRSAAIKVWNVHYNYHRTHTACGNQPPATRTPARVMNVMTSNT